MAGSDVEMTVESICSMKRATARIIGTMRFMRGGPGRIRTLMQEDRSFEAETADVQPLCHHFPVNPGAGIGWGAMFVAAYRRNGRFRQRRNLGGTTMTSFSSGRRGLFKVTAGGALAAPFILARATQAQEQTAETTMTPAKTSGFNIGAFKVTVISDGSRLADNPHETFGINQ